ncbi:hypothetical protein M441DRAFT_48222 [Trichoderma asperellum CBS 433.97]|uniref:Uncharacterized protein n=1 Tax=Trichoderma asperellum (strain ATCC 204424 / CBS 433.97 / NBRC 101777) TaxID=1042311 RepID=A0A2T3Z6E5_TRIA4|nr:hypothetical protein M441DRAFT_48222 [Trichoderma asperellum CBS 433.97]PTB40378.1 hypothetical protein M441DRAFT_48222 [Trichoderma asperellum CBS 433.97]
MNALAAISYYVPKWNFIAYCNDNHAIHLNGLIYDIELKRGTPTFYYSTAERNLNCRINALVTPRDVSHKVILDNHEVSFLDKEKTARRLLQSLFSLEQYRLRLKKDPIYLFPEASNHFSHSSSLYPIVYITIGKLLRTLQYRLTMIDDISEALDALSQLKSAYKDRLANGWTPVQPSSLIDIDNGTANVATPAYSGMFTYTNAPDVGTVSSAAAGNGCIINRNQSERSFDRLSSDEPFGKG